MADMVKTPPKTRVEVSLGKLRGMISGIHEKPLDEAQQIVEAIFSDTAPRPIRQELQHLILRRPESDSLRIEVLLENLSDPDFNIRYIASNSLGEAARENEELRTRLIGMARATLCSTKKEEIRSGALLALAVSQGLIRDSAAAKDDTYPADSRVKEVFKEVAVEWDRPHLAADSVKYLGRMGPAATDALPVLRRNMQMQVDETRPDKYAWENLIRESAAAIGKITAGSEETDIT